MRKEKGAENMQLFKNISPKNALCRCGKGANGLGTRNWELKGLG